MHKLDGMKVAILSTDGFEQSELFEPKRRIEDAGGEVVVLSIMSDPITGWHEKNWGESVDVDLLVNDAVVNDYAGLVLPGGQINPDVLRKHGKAVDFIRHFVASGKPVAAICHAPWLLVEAGVVKGRDLTSYSSIATDLKNAGANWSDQDVVVDKNLITSRSPEDLDVFISTFLAHLSSASE